MPMQHGRSTISSLKQSKETNDNMRALVIDAMPVGMDIGDQGDAEAYSVGKTGMFKLSLYHRNVPVSAVGPYLFCKGPECIITVAWSP